MTHMKFMLEDCAIAQAVGLWPLMAEVWVRSQVSPCGICGGQYGTRSSFSPSTSVFLCQYHCTDAPYSFLPTFSSYQNDKLAKPGNLKEQTSFVCRWTLDGRVLSLFPGTEVLTPFAHVCLTASARAQFTCSACLIYKTDAVNNTDYLVSTICPVWCCYLDVTVWTADCSIDSALLLLPSLARAHNY